MVQDSIAPNPINTIDSAVTRTKCNVPPSPICTPAIETTGLPAPRAAVMPPTARTIHIQRRGEGSAPRGMCASRAAVISNTNISPTLAQPG